VKINAALATSAVVLASLVGLSSVAVYHLPEAAGGEAPSCLTYRSEYYIQPIAAGDWRHYPLHIPSAKATPVGWASLSKSVKLEQIAIRPTPKRWRPVMRRADVQPLNILPPVWRGPGDEVIVQSEALVDSANSRTAL
jgi:hypothetical protein